MEWELCEGSNAMGEGSTTRGETLLPATIYLHNICPDLKRCITKVMTSHSQGVIMSHPQVVETPGHQCPVSRYIFCDMHKGKLQATPALSLRGLPLQFHHRTSFLS